MESHPGCSGSLYPHGHSSFTTVFTTGCRQISAVVPGAPPPSPFSLTWMSAQLFLSHFFRFLFPVSFFLPSYMHFSRSVLKPAALTVGHSKNIWHLLRERNPVSLLPKACQPKHCPLVVVIQSIKVLLFQMYI